MADDTAVSNFCSLTGSDSATAQQYLSACDGNVELAISAFFDSAAGDAGAQMQQDENDTLSSRPGSVAENYTGPRTLDGRPAPDISTSTPSAPSATSKGKSSAPRRGAIATMADMRAAAASSEGPGPSSHAGHGHSDDEEDEEDDIDEKDKPQSFYTGGEKSGLSVEDPNRKGHNKLVSALLKKAAQNGAADGQPGGSSSSRGAARSSGGMFTGTAHTLGSDDVPSQMIPDPAKTASPSQTSRRSQHPLAGLMPGFFGQSGANQDDDDDDTDLDTPVTRVLTLWSDGLSIDDGELIARSDPRYKEILENLNQDRAPLSLLGVKFGQRVDIQIADRKTEAYRPPPKKPMKAFEGQGNRLGSPAPAIASGSSKSANPVDEAARSKSAQAFEPSKTAFQVDNSLPTTSIQIRLGSGERMVGRFNHTHTVRDVMNYINASQPGASARSYVLQTTFPSRELSDDSQTVKDAGLLNAVVTVKYT